MTDVKKTMNTLSSRGWTVTSSTPDPEPDTPVYMGVELRRALNKVQHEIDPVACIALIDKGAELNGKDGHNGWTALFYAVQTKQMDVVQHLISKGADLTIKSISGHTARDIASMCNASEIADFLDQAQIRIEDERKRFLEAGAPLKTRAPMMKKIVLKRN